MKYLLLFSSVICFGLAIACAALNQRVNGPVCDERSLTSNGTPPSCSAAPKEKAEPGVAHR